MAEVIKTPGIEIPKQEYVELKADETVLSILIYYFLDYLEEKDENGKSKHYYDPEVVKIIFDGRYSR